MNFTKWFKLRKPEQEEFYDVDDFNFNADILDTELKNVKDNYLPLTGGTVTGNVVINGALTVPNGLIRTNDTSKSINIRCTADDKSGAKLLLAGKNATNNAGEFIITATNGTNTFNFCGLPNGKLRWGNKNIVRSINNTNADDNGNVSITSVNHATNADKARSASSATKASQNSSGYALANTIVKAISIDGRTITITKIDGTSYKLTTQDTNTVYTKLSQFTNDVGFITSAGSCAHAKTADKASQDKNGAQIDTTYFKSANGTFTGNEYNRNVSNSFLRLSGGNTRNGGAVINLYGKDATNRNGQFVVGASSKGDGSDYKYLRGTPTGSLIWDGKNIVRSVNGINADDKGNVALNQLEKVSLLSSRKGDGNWTLSNVVIGKPIFITHNGGSLPGGCALTVVSGSNDMRTKHFFGVWNIVSGQFLITEGAAASVVVVPTANTVVVRVENSSDDGDTLRAYQ